MSSFTTTAVGRGAIQFLCILLLCAAGPASPQSERMLGLQQSVETLRQNAERLRSGLDRSQFDLAALLDSKDFDADSIIEFVSNEIRVEIYAGALRGGLGTLLSGSGNALDQALLAATLLRDAGYDVVIRRGTLNNEQANDLVNLMFAPVQRSPHPGLGKPAEIDEAILAEQAASRDAWIHAAASTAKRVEDTLKDAGLDITGEQMVATVRTEATDYYWVEYRDGPSAPWVEVHPALRQSPNVEADKTYKEGIPAELAHEVVIEVLVDQRQGSQTLVSHLFSPIRLLGPELADLSLQISLLPDQLLNGDAPLDLAKLADDTTFISPIVNGGMPAGAMALSLRGLLVPMETLSLGAADYFETVSEKGVQAISAVSSLGSGEESNEAPIEIEAIRLKVSFLMPDGKKRVAERDWFSKLRDIGEVPGASMEHKRALVAGIARSHHFSFATGSLSAASFIDPMVDNIESMQSAIEAAKSIDPDDCMTLRCFLGLEWQPPEPNHSASMMYLAFDDIESAAPANTIRYRHMPGLYLQSSPILPQSASQPAANLRLDIVSNAKRAFAGNGDRISADTHRQILAGAWETQIETEVFGKPDAVPPRAATAPTLLRAIEHMDIDRFVESGSVARAIKRDLDSGYAVLAEESIGLGGSDESTRWWRVDPVTAETLGMNHYGGAVSTEALAMIGGGLVFAAAVAGSVIVCMETVGAGPAICAACGNPVSTASITAWAAVETIAADPLDYGGFWLQAAGDIFTWCRN